MFNANFSTIPTIRTSDRLICVWVPTGNPRMPLTCVWIQDAPSREDLIVDGVVDDPDPEHYFFSYALARPVYSSACIPTLIFAERH